jgi:hypothetical protein
LEARASRRRSPGRSWANVPDAFRTNSSSRGVRGTMPPSSRFSSWAARISTRRFRSRLPASMTWPSSPLTVAPWIWPGALAATPRRSSTSRPFRLAASSTASVAFARLPPGLDIWATFCPLSQDRHPSAAFAGAKVIVWAWKWTSPPRFSAWKYARERVRASCHSRTPPPTRTRTASRSTSARWAATAARRTSRAISGWSFRLWLSSAGRVINASLGCLNRPRPWVSLFPSRSYPMDNCRSSSGGGSSCVAGSQPTSRQRSALMASGFTWPSRLR